MQQCTVAFSSYNPIPCSYHNLCWMKLHASGDLSEKSNFEPRMYFKDRSLRGITPEVVPPCRRFGNRLKTMDTKRAIIKSRPVWPPLKGDTRDAELHRAWTKVKHKKLPYLWPHRRCTFHFVSIVFNFFEARHTAAPHQL